MRIASAFALATSLAFASPAAAAEYMYGAVCHSEEDLLSLFGANTMAKHRTVDVVHFYGCRITTVWVVAGVILDLREHPVEGPITLRSVTVTKIHDGTTMRSVSPRNLYLGQYFNGRN